MDVYLERQLPFLVADVVDVLEGGLMGRVVDQDVDATKDLDGVLDDEAAVLGVLQVAGANTALRPSFSMSVLTSFASSGSSRYAMRMSAPSRA